MNPRVIAESAQLACALEAACPKPGNVNRFQDFSDTKLEHFLASAIAIGNASRIAAGRGYSIKKKRLNYASLGLGELIMRTVKDSQQWHLGRNTNLGISMLLIPLSASYGLALEANDFRDKIVRREVDGAVKNTTTKDALNLYKAIKIALPGGLGSVKALDVMDESSMREIARRGLTLHHVLTLANEDSVPTELIKKMPVTFELGCPEIMRVYKETGDLTLATLHGYMRILAEIPDSLIARKKGLKAAKEISTMAKELLMAGISMDNIKDFDRRIRRPDNSLNPGATADLTASSLMVCLLKGARP